MRLILERRTSRLHLDREGFNAQEAASADNDAADFIALGLSITNSNFDG